MKRLLGLWNAMWRVILALVVDLLSRAVERQLPVMLEPIKGEVLINGVLLV